MSPTQARLRAAMETILGSVWIPVVAEINTLVVQRYEEVRTLSDIVKNIPGIILILLPLHLN
jgi:hypothetical protein